MTWVLLVSPILLAGCRTVPVEEGLPAARKTEPSPAMPKNGHLPQAVPSTPESPDSPDPAGAPDGEGSPAAAAAEKQPDPAQDLIETYLQSLSLSQKIGQRFISWIPGTEISERSRRLIQEGTVGGVILSAENARNREQLRRLTAGLQEQAAGAAVPIGLLIGVDQEGGRVSRVRFETSTRFPSPFIWGEYMDSEFVEAAAYVLNRELRDLGCNLNFAPVLDLYDRPDDSIVGDRSMGSEPGTVGRFGQAYLSGARRAGIVSVVKHFPGHGRTLVDSHRKLPEVEADVETLLQRDLIPFRMAVDAGAEAVMTAHILYPQLDPKYPVTLSRTILQGLLREQLGFQGVIVSDDIGMGALTGRFAGEDVLRLSLLAGVDLILIHAPQDALRMKETILRLVREGQISEAAIDEGLRRVLRLKLRCGLLPR